MRLWDLQGEQLAEWLGHNNSIASIDLNSDGKLLATSDYEGTAKLWQIESFERLIERSCAWMQDYLAHNSTLEKSDRSLCEQI
ncbi:MAG: hypothetical protein QNJ41_13720 [Xenococcaceae cyanobacterium MO_188.B32]|nr:hypothetical protein [Xenococcaceae cyanobacterium MO_188.B32]